MGTLAERGSDQAVEAALAELLGSHPGAALCAMGEDAVTVPMPDSVPLAGHRVVSTRSPIDLVLAEDRVAVIGAWDTVRATGGTHASVPVRLVSEPDRVVSLHVFDARARHGAFLAVVVPTDTDESDLHIVVADQPPAPLVPRFGRARHNEVGLFLEVDDEISQMLGWDRDEMVGHLSLDFIHPDDHDTAINNWIDMLAARRPVSRVRLRHHRRDDSWLWMEITNHNLLDDLEHDCVVAEMLDISDEMAAHDEIKSRQQLLERLAEALPVGVVQVDADGRVVYTNSRFLSVLHVPRPATVEEQLDAVLPEDRGDLAEAFDAVLNGRSESDVEVRLRPPPGEDGKDSRRCTFSLRALTAEAGEVTGAIVCVADVTESARLRDELHMRATFDEVTRCHNRTSTLALLESWLADADVSAPPAVIFVDLDRFKAVNDEFGHAAGDELLAIVARRLVGAVRADDVVGRIGGDEFLVIRRATADAEQAMTVATRVAETFRHPVLLKAGSVACRASIGVAWSSEPSLDAERLVAMADAAMYEAKRTGCPDPVLYHG